MRFPRQIRPVLVTLLVLVALASCSGAATGPTPTPVPATAAAPRTVLLLWHAWPTPESRTLLELIDRFNRANPAFQIVPQMRPAARLSSDLLDASAEGGGPHLALVPSHSIGTLVQAGALLPVDDLLPANTLTQILPAASGGTQVQSTDSLVRYGIPVTFDTLALFYNKANFTGAPPADTETMLQVARDIANVDSAPPYWGMAYTLSLDRTLCYFYAFGGQIFDAQGKVSLGGDGRAGTEAWLTWLLALREDPEILASSDGVAVANALSTQRALMTIDWAHALASYRAIWPDSMGVAPLPRLSPTNASPRPYVQSDALVLNARLGPSEREAAAAFARYLIDEPSQRELLRAGRQPVLLSLDLNAADTALAPALREAAIAFRAQGEAGQPMPNSRSSNELVWAVLTDMQNSALRRVLTPAQAVTDADSTLRLRLSGP